MVQGGTGVRAPGQGGNHHDLPTEILQPEKSPEFTLFRKPAKVVLASASGLHRTAADVDKRDLQCLS
jgi:hypothetical protein